MDFSLYKMAQNKQSQQNLISISLILFHIFRLNMVLEGEGHQGIPVLS